MASKNIRLISQYLVPRDAVSRHVFEIGAFLEEQGHRVSYHAMGFAPEFQSKVRPISELASEVGPDDVLFYQYSIWDKNLPLVLSLKNRKIVYYHGITTPSLLETLMPETAQDCRKGLEALPLLSQFDSIAANSQFDLDQIKKHFTPKMEDVLPPYIRNEFYSSPKLEKAPNRNHLIYVGRFYPHKNIEKVIRVFRELQQLNPSYQLTLAGSGSLVLYLAKLNEIVGEDPSIHFSFNLTPAELIELYRSAAALINFSLHEGFGVPFIEAFQLHVPVVSHSHAAIAETLQGSGILLEDNFTHADIKNLHQQLQNGREAIINKQNLVFEKNYSDAVVVNKYRSFFKKVL